MSLTRSPVTSSKSRLVGASILQCAIRPSFPSAHYYILNDISHLSQSQDISRAEIRARRYTQRAARRWCDNRVVRAWLAPLMLAAAPRAAAPSPVVAARAGHRAGGGVRRGRGRTGPDRGRPERPIGARRGIAARQPGPRHLAGTSQPRRDGPGASPAARAWLGVADRGAADEPGAARRSGRASGRDCPVGPVASRRRCPAGWGPAARSAVRCCSSAAAAPESLRP